VLQAAAAGGVYLQEDSPKEERRYRARFWFDPTGLNPPARDRHFAAHVFGAFSENPTHPLAELVLTHHRGYFLHARVRLDDGSLRETARVSLATAPHVIALDWRRATGPSVADGGFELWIDGASVAALVGLDNDLEGVGFARMGALAVGIGASGFLRWDDFEWRRETGP
jgi:hypothetical protein